MSILDDAIREHLELKRAHGADDAELKKLEDEAFGPPARPDEHDPFAEAPTEFLVAPEVGAGEQDDEEPAGRRAPNIADLQESPLPPPEAPPEEQPAMEHEAVSAPHPEGEPEPQAEIEGGHSTEERHAIAEQPTEMFDVEGQFEDAATESDAPSDDDLVEAELAEPRLAPVDPLAGIEASMPGKAELELADEEEDADEFDEFFSEQRLSDELNQALEAPLPDEPGAPPTEEATAIFNLEETEVADEEESLDEEEVEEPLEGEFEEISDELEIPAPAEAPEPADEPDTPLPPPAAGHEDLLEDTPDFLEDAPEDDNLWFEQKPPKDIDFGD
jgi:hypothetical protein